MKHIILSNTPRGWMAQFVGDAEVIEAFGVDTIPTAFTSQASAGTVLEAITRLNPGCVVSIGNR